MTHERHLRAATRCWLLFAAWGIVCAGLSPAPIAHASDDDTGEADSVEGARARAIARDRSALIEELQQVGSWDDWLTRIQPWRADVRANVSSAMAEERQFIDMNRAVCIEYTDELTIGRNLLFHAISHEALFPWPELSNVSETVVFQSILRLDRELKARGIDLIFVPIPTAVEIYAHLVSEKAPDDLSTVPLRKAYVLALLDHGVETLDLGPAFRRARQENDEWLFVKNEWHWARLAIALTAETVAERLQRYHFEAAGKTSYTANEIVIDKSQTWAFHRPYKESESEDWVVDQVLLDGTPYESVDDAPVVVLGDSFVGHLGQWHADFPAHLAKELGMPITSEWQSGGGPRVPQTLARKGNDYLEGRRVIVWVMNSFPMTDLKRWRVIDLP